jgi:hypothetical protein
MTSNDDLIAMAEREFRKRFPLPPLPASAQLAEEHARVQPWVIFEERTGKGSRWFAAHEATGEIREMDIGGRRGQPLPFLQAYIGAGFPTRHDIPIATGPIRPDHIGILRGMAGNLEAAE